MNKFTLLVLPLVLACSAIGAMAMQELPVGDAVEEKQQKEAKLFKIVVEECVRNYWNNKVYFSGSRNRKELDKAIDQFLTEVPNFEEEPGTVEEIEQRIEEMEAEANEALLKAENYSIHKQLEEAHTWRAKEAASWAQVARLEVTLRKLLSKDHGKLFAKLLKELAKLCRAREVAKPYLKDGMQWMRIREYHRKMNELVEVTTEEDLKDISELSEDEIEKRIEDLTREANEFAKKAREHDRKGEREQCAECDEQEDAKWIEIARLEVIRRVRPYKKAMGKGDK